MLPPRPASKRRKISQLFHDPERPCNIGDGGISLPLAAIDAFYHITITHHIRPAPENRIWRNFIQELCANTPCACTWNGLAYQTNVEPGFRSRTGSHEQGTNLPQRRQCILPLRRRQLSVRCVTTVSKWSCELAPKKTLKLTVECLHCSRFASRSLFNCGIRVEIARVSRDLGRLQPSAGYGFKLSS